MTDSYQTIFRSYESAINETRGILSERELKREYLEKSVADIKIEIDGYRNQVTDCRRHINSFDGTGGLHSYEIKAKFQEEVRGQQQLLIEKVHSTLVQTRERHEREIFDLQLDLDNLKSKIDNANMTKVGGSSSSAGPRSNASTSRAEGIAPARFAMLDKKHEAVKASYQKTAKAYAAVNRTSEVGTAYNGPATTVDLDRLPRPAKGRRAAEIKNLTKGLDNCLQSLKQSERAMDRVSSQLANAGATPEATDAAAADGPVLAAAKPALSEENLRAKEAAEAFLEKHPYTRETDAGFTGA